MPTLLSILPQDRFLEWSNLRSQVLSVSQDASRSEGLAEFQTRPGEYRAYLVRQGWLEVRSGDEKITVNRGQWLLCFGNKISEGTSSDLELLSLQLVLSWADGAPLLSSPPGYCLLEAARYPDLETAARRFLLEDLPLGTEQSDYVAYLRQQRRLIDWTELIVTALLANGGQLHLPGEVDPRLAAALSLLDHHPVTGILPAEKATAEASLSLGQLNRMCQKCYGLTLHGYWERRRINHAIFLLRQSGCRVKEVASKLNFTQLSHFSVWFKRHTSQAPRAFCRPQQK